MEIIQAINWIDILMGVILIRVLYIGLKEGMIAEIFKLLGVVFAVFISLHYYGLLGKMLISRINFPLDLVNFTIFLLLWILVVLIFMLIRQGMMVLIKAESHSPIDRWIGSGLSFIRAGLLCSLTIVSLQLSGIEYIQRTLKKSLTAQDFVVLSTKLYQISYDTVVKRIFPTEEFNKAVLKVAQIDSGKEHSK